jgi:2-oxoglutarate dehydrogenase E1 component
VDKTQHVEAAGDALVGASAEFIERLLDDYARQPQAVPAEWGRLFESLDGAAGAAADGASQRKQEQVDRLVWAFRTRGHLAAQLDPLNLEPQREASELRAEHYGLDATDLARRFVTWPARPGGNESLAELIERLRATYCGTIGHEFAHIRDVAARQWLLEKIERAGGPPKLSREWSERFLQQVMRADHLERFTRKRYPGTKTFSLEGAEALIPLLTLAIDRAAEQGVEAIVMGMAHRGRLNVLANILGNRPRDIFRQFEPTSPHQFFGRGDVRYHLGDNGQFTTASGGQVELSLLFNPSHLEYVAPVALGRVRARQDRHGDEGRRQSMAVMIHGDAALAGEGVAFETLNLGRLPAYQTGGGLRIVINNQIGFTTTPAEGRSTVYATDVARAFDIPIWHVNGDDLGAVAWVTQLALEYRAEFRSDALIDLVCYRRWGHNESDEPALTQPRMYSVIEHHPTLREQWSQRLVSEGIVTREQVTQLDTQCSEHLRAELEAAVAKPKAGESEHVARPAEVLERWEPLPRGVWDEYYGGAERDDEADTGVAEPRLKDLLQKLAQTPADFHVHKKLQAAMARRQAMAEGREPLDWSAAEALALASLAVEGHHVRIAGQDTARGTFSHRHATLHDVMDGRPYNTFADLAPQQAAVEVINSPLCEAAAVGFEYGYSMGHPAALVAWEAQFGDFVNAAQVYLDQFLSSGEDKWGQLSGLVLLLPHGFEGQGPEHSSARLERLLDMAGEDSLQVVQPTTPAQYFHVLRRQVLRPWRKPLFVLTPKSLLRHPQVRSPLADVAGGRFERVIGDAAVEQPSRVLMCSGKIYYDLLAYRERHALKDVALIRVEQFYPLRDQHLASAFAACAAGTPVTWVQEEPENMGAWRYWQVRYGDRLLGRYPLSAVTRAASASPATGSKASHKAEQEQLLQRAFGREAATSEQPAREEPDKEHDHAA